jgi:hypothetical protein
MVRSVLILVLSAACYTISANDDGDKRLDAFLSKVETFYKHKELNGTNWKMPNTNPESNIDNMPTNHGILSKTDHASGLEYILQTGKLVDLELGIELDTVTGVVYDYKTEKEYKLSDLLAQRDKKL